MASTDMAGFLLRVYDLKDCLSARPGQLLVPRWAVDRPFRSALFSGRPPQRQGAPRPRGQYGRGVPLGDGITIGGDDERKPRREAESPGVRILVDAPADAAGLRDS